MDVFEIEKLACKYEYISFDIFDTLIFRTVKNPEDIFKLVELMYNQSYEDGIDFTKARIQAEIMARKKNYPKEIKIDQIYENINCSDDIRSRYLLLEQQMEIDNCIPNPLMLEFVEWCKEQKKHIIVITDMYLDKETISKILKKIGMQYEKLYISGDIGLTKSSGELFNYVLQDLNIESNKMFHTGDNQLNDLKNPLKYGIRSFERVSNVNNAKLYKTNEYKNDISYQHQQYFVEEWFRNLLEVNSESRIGFQLLGPVVYEFCKWLHEQKDKNKIDRLLFVAREGFFLKKCYELMYPSDNCGYIYMNRNLLRIPSTTKDTVANIFMDSVNGSEIFTLKNLFEVFDIETEKIMCLNNIKLNLEQRFTKADLQNGKLDEVFILIWDQIKHERNNQEEYLMEYLENNHFFDEKIGLVNNSMNGTGQKLLFDFIEKSMRKAEIIGLQFIKTKKCVERLQDKSISWLDQIREHHKYEFAMNSLLLEHLLFDSEGTAIKFDKKEDKIGIICEKQRTEWRNNKVVFKIQENAFEYIKQYLSHVEIPIGTQAIMNFLSMVRNPLKEDAMILCNFFDDDIWGDYKLVELDEKFRWCFLFDKKIPNNIKWMQGYLVANDYKKFYIDIFNRMRSIKMYIKRCLGRGGF